MYTTSKSINTRGCYSVEHNASRLHLRQIKRGIDHFEHAFHFFMIFCSSRNWICRRHIFLFNEPPLVGCQPSSYSRWPEKVVIAGQPGEDGVDSYLTIFARLASLQAAWVTSWRRGGPKEEDYPGITGLRKNVLLVAEAADCPCSHPPPSL